MSSVLRIYTLALLVSRVPVSELHSSLVSTCIHTTGGELKWEHQWQKSEETIREASPDGNEMLLNGRAPLPGELMTFPTLAQSFHEIATHGKDGFYKGRIAEEIVRIVKSKGGVMELEDLAKHKTDFVDPIKYTYKNELTVYEVSRIIL